MLGSQAASYVVHQNSNGFKVEYIYRKKASGDKVGHCMRFIVTKEHDIKGTLFKGENFVSMSFSNLALSKATMLLIK